MRQEEVENRLQELESYLKAKSLYTGGMKRQIANIREANETEFPGRTRVSMGQLELFAVLKESD